jgi:hypothetical protein
MSNGVENHLLTPIDKQTMLDFLSSSKRRINMLWMGDASRFPFFDLIKNSSKII